MRQWTGVIDNVAPVGDGFQDMRNVSMRVQGELRRRSTLSNRIATSLTNLRMAAHETLGGDQVSAPTAAPVLSATIPGGLGTVGVHLVRYRYYDSVQGIASAPSPSASITLSGANLRISVAMAANALADSYIIEQTTAGGSTFYIDDTTIPNGSFDFTFGTVTGQASTADITLVSNGVYGGSVNTSLAAGSWLLQGSSAAVTGVDLTAGTSFACLSGLTNSTFYPSYAYMNQTTYVNNGVDRMQRITRGDTAGSAAGIDAPATPPSLGQAGSGSVNDGTHLVRYRYWDQLRNRYSDPSETATIDMAQSDAGTLTATITALGTVGYGRIIVEMTLATGTEFYIAGYALNIAGAQAVVITLSDQQLAVQTPANVYAGPDGFGHEPPPVCRLVCAHRGRAFQWYPTSGNQRDLLYWSRVGLPESWKASEWARTGTLVSGDSPAALLSFQDDLYLIGRRSMTRLLYTSDPADGILTQLPTNLGAFNQACVLAVDSNVYGFGRNGMWRISGIMPRMVSDPIDDIWQAEMDFDNVNDCFVCYDGIDKVVRFFYSTTGSRGKKCACFHLETEMWSFDTFLNEISHGVQASTFDGNTYLYLAEGISYAGDTWSVQLNGYGDGFSTAETGYFTAAAGSTTTVINTSQAMTASAYVGAYLYVPSTGESRRISANTPTTITVPALSGAPATGTDLYIGSVQFYIDPFWSSLSGQQIGRNRSTYLMMENVNDQESPDFTVRFYADYSSSAFALTNSGSDTYPQGVTIVNGTSYATISMDQTQGGVCAVPFPSTWNRVIKYTIEQRKPEGVIKLIDARWQATPKEVQPERSQA